MSYDFDAACLDSILQQMTISNAMITLMSTDVSRCEHQGAGRRTTRWLRSQSILYHLEKS